MGLFVLEDKIILAHGAVPEAQNVGKIKSRSYELICSGRTKIILAHGAVPEAQNVGKIKSRSYGLICSGRQNNISPRSRAGGTKRGKNQIQKLWAYLFWKNKN